MEFSWRWKLLITLTQAPLTVLTARILFRGSELPWAKLSYQTHGDTIEGFMLKISNFSE
jgi:hypothetical protein